MKPNLFNAVTFLPYTIDGSHEDTRQHVVCQQEAKNNSSVLNSKVINGSGKKVDFHTLVLLKNATLRAARGSCYYYYLLFCTFFGRQAREVRAGASLFSLRRLVANLLALRWA
jgi:hypothetical protein